MITGCHTTWAFVSDMDRAVEFYGDVLGLLPNIVSPYWSEFVAGQLKVGLHPGNPPSEPKGWFLGLAADSLKELRQQVENSSGKVIDDYHETPGGVVLTIADPDGNPIQVVQPGSKLADFV